MFRFYRFVLNKPVLIIAILAIITIFFAFFIPRISFDADISKMIPEEDPVIKDLIDAVEEFGSQEIFMIVIRDEDIFTPVALKKINSISREIKELRGVKKVTTPLNVELIESSFLGIEINSITEKIPQTEEEINDYKEKILSSAQVGRLITEDGKAAAILITMEAFGNLSTHKRKTLTGKVDRIVNYHRGAEEIFIVGEAYSAYYAEQSMKKDIIYLLPLIFFIIIGILYWSFHSIQGIVLPLMTVLISVIWTVGLMAILKIPMTIVTMVMPVILVAIGSADGIHILNKYYEALARGMDKKEALQETMMEMNGPVIMTSLTTGAGFFALITSFVTPIREFGILTAFGVIAAMFFSLMFIPAALVMQKLPAHFQQERREHKERLVNFLIYLGRFIARKPVLTLFISLIIFIFFIMGSFRITTESNMLNYFQKDSPIIRGTDIVEEEFGGTMQVSLVFDTGVADGIKSPEVLKKMIETQNYLNSLNHVSHATSIADLIRELNQALNMGEAEYYKIPDKREAVAQELLLFTMQGGSGLDSLVSYNFDRGLVTARIRYLSTGELRKVINKIENFVDNYLNRGDYLKVKVVGFPSVSLKLTERFITSQCTSLITSVVTVGTIVAILMGSYFAGLLSILPLLLTVGINFGIMGYQEIPLDAVTTMIASIAIGIGVDYSIHYISRYRLEIREGKDKQEAVINTGRTAGRGIFFNALALIFGFSILGFSHFRAIDVFGLLIGLTMLISSLASLTVIPAILRIIPVKKIIKRSEFI